MQYIEQTNRTILFDEVNPNLNNIFTLIGDTKGKESLSDDEIKEIDDYLSITSFSEFLEKFAPTVYMATDLEQEKVRFFFERPTYAQSDTVPIKLNMDNRLISMLAHMLDVKLDTSFIPQENLSDIVHYLFPKQETEAFVKFRREIKECFLAHKEKDLIEKMDIMISRYNTPLLQLQLFLKESKAYLFDLEGDSNDIINLKTGDNTQVHILEASKRFQKMEPSMTVQSKQEFESFLKNYIASHPLKNEKWFLFNLLTSCGYDNNLAEACADLYNRSLDFYAKTISLFWKSIRPLLQTMLGIKVFFEQYSVKNGIMPPVLLITNCTADMILQEKYRTDFTIYLETVNLKSYYASTIWYAIISNIKYINVTTKRLTRERFVGNEQEEEKTERSMEAIQLLMDILGRYRIQAFLSTEASDNNNFTNFTETGIRLFEQSFAPFEKMEHSDYLIPCMPNFTIIPKEHAKLYLDRKCTYEDFGEITIKPTDYKTIWLSGLYLEASFVAAGLYAACQCPVYLLSRFQGKVDLELQGVAYRIMENNNRNITTSLLKKELFTYSEELMEEIRQIGYGIVFGPGKQGNIVLSDKTMAYLRGMKDCVATVQTMTYMERNIRHATQDYRSNLITEFFQNRPDSIRSKWMKNPGTVNSILKTGETMEYHINDKEGTCVIELVFSELAKKEKVRISR